MMDRDALIRAIVENSDEDTPRLMLADYLQENGEEPRAEFIRLQVEFVRNPASYAFNTATREQELLRTNEAAWQYRTPIGKRLTCPDCIHWKGRVPKDCRCGGTRRLWEHPVTWTRGFPCVTVRWEDVGMSSATTPWQFYPLWLSWACRCVRECGASFHVEGRDFSWKARVWDSSDEPEHENVPSELFDEMMTANPEFYQGSEGRNRLMEYPTTELAHAALDVAITRLVVRQAWKQVSVSK